ncbi:MAG: PIN domain-containing protein [Actinobacteria bacterium]|nr:PIN domain-containing protein [Actinomycetota bacterium]
MRFVDSSFWVGLTSPRDRRHESAVAIWGSRPGPLVTSNHVLGETWTFLRRRASHREAGLFLDRVWNSTTVDVEFVDEGTEDVAWRWLRRHDERNYSFVDATSFAMMRRLRIREALAFDGDFSAAGFIEVRPET